MSVNERFHNRMTKVDFEEFILQHKLTWYQLQRLVIRVNNSTDDIFDHEISIEKPAFDNQSQWEYTYEKIAEKLRILHLLKIPMHYKSNGMMYVVREECEHILFNERDEQELEVLNEEYLRYQQARKGSKEKQIAETNYSTLTKRMFDRGVQFWFNKQYEQFEFVKYDDNWLDTF